MADIAKINVNDFDYDIKDASAREDINEIKEDLNDINTSIEGIKSNFQAGVDSIYNAVIAKGTTPASKSLGDIAEAINNLSRKPSHGTFTLINGANTIELDFTPAYFFAFSDSGRYSISSFTLANGQITGQWFYKGTTTTNGGISISGNKINFNPKNASDNRYASYFAGRSYTWFAG